MNEWMNEFTKNEKEYIQNEQGKGGGGNEWTNESETPVNN